MSQKTSINVEPLTCAIGPESRDEPSGQLGDLRRWIRGASVAGDS